MTRKDYERTAAILRSVTDQKILESLCNKFADFFASENPRFDRDRFRTACLPTAANGKTASRKRARSGTSQAVLGSSKL